MTRNNKPHGVSIIYAITGGWVADSSIAQIRPRGDFLSVAVLHSPALQTASPAALPVPAEPVTPGVSGGGEKEQAGSTPGGLSFTGMAVGSALSDSLRKTNKYCGRNLNTPWLLL